MSQIFSLIKITSYYIDTNTNIRSIIDEIEPALPRKVCENWTSRLFHAHAQYGGHKLSFG